MKHLMPLSAGSKRSFHSKWFWIVLIMNAAVVLPCFVSAAEVLDDSISPKKQYATQFKWVHPGNFGASDQEQYLLLEGRQGNVEVWLDTADYKGRNARIYLRLPRQIEGFGSAGHFTLRWETNRIFSSGEVRPGNRTLIYNGPVHTDRMVELFTFILRIDASYLTGKIRYAPIFEIEPY